MRFADYIRVTSLEEARRILDKDENSVILGGTTYLRLSEREYSTAIDLSDLGLGYIREAGGIIEIGAYTTLREIEISGILDHHFGGFFSDAVRNIVGIQFRNCATIGGAVCGRFGFSELITVLSVLDCELEFDRSGRVSMIDFISNGKARRDILKRIILGTNNGKYSYESQRNSDADFPLLSVAASFEEKLKIAVGGRPGTAKLSKTGVEHLNSNASDIEKGVKLIQDEFTFGTDIRASAEYRKIISSVLVKRVLAEVL